MRRSSDFKPLAVFLPLEQKIATNYRCKGMPLSSFLLKPMQRITRYPLLIKNVCGAEKKLEFSFNCLCKSLRVPVTLLALLLFFLRSWSTRQRATQTAIR